MPDVLTHLLVGISIALLVRRDGPRSEQMLIVLGAVLIDVERPVAWVLSATVLDWIGLGSAFHSILGAVVLSYSAGACFDLERPVFKARMGLIFIGCISHLILDMVMYPWTELGISLLYPLQLPFSFHLLWPDFWLYPLFGLALLLLVLGAHYILYSFRHPKSERELT